MFDSSKVESSNSGYISKYLNPGLQNLKINSIEISEAKTGSKKLVLHTEGEEVKDLGFEGVDGAKGPVGKIATFYFKPEEMEEKVSRIFSEIADALEAKPQLDAIQASTLEEYISKVAPLITGKFANFKIAGEEYAKGDGKVGVKLLLPSKYFVEKAGRTPSKLKFDKNNTYDYKKLVQPDNFTPISNDLGLITPDDSQLPF
jgi:hypothetical protein